jgi:hypothetical protein
VTLLVFFFIFPLFQKLKVKEEDDNKKMSHAVKESGVEHGSWRMQGGDMEGWHVHKKPLCLIHERRRFFLSQGSVLGCGDRQ